MTHTDQSLLLLRPCLAGGLDLVGLYLAVQGVTQSDGVATGVISYAQHTCLL